MDIDYMFSLLLLLLLCINFIIDNTSGMIFIIGFIIIGIDVKINKHLK